MYDRQGRIVQVKGDEGQADMRFTYDHTGVLGCTVGDSLYLYRKDAQGNMIAMLDTDGNIVVQYKDGAWGNHFVLDCEGNEITDTEHIGHRNPFRYRGYYYDTTSGFYYLKSRFYDPETGRFLSPDSVEHLDHETIGGLNLYAYCNNNPVMYSDPEGHSWDDFLNIATKVISGVGSAALGLVTLVRTANPILAIKQGMQAWAINDIYQLASGRVSAQISEKGDVEITNSNNLVSPVAQTVYTFYLNHVNSETKDVIKGTTRGAQGELLAHNLAYYVLSMASGTGKLFGRNTTELDEKRGFANPANIGGTVFDNGDNRIAKGMVAFNIITRPIATLIDFLVWKFQ